MVFGFNADCSDSCYDSIMDEYGYILPFQTFRLQNINPELLKRVRLTASETVGRSLVYNAPGMRNMLFFSAVMQIASAFQSAIS